MHDVDNAWAQLLTHSLTHSTTHSFIYSLIHSFIHSITHSLTHSFNHTFIPSLIYSLIHSFTHSLTHPMRTHGQPSWCRPWILLHMLRRWCTAGPRDCAAVGRCLHWCCWPGRRRGDTSSDHHRRYCLQLIDSTAIYVGLTIAFIGLSHMPLPIHTDCHRHRWPSSANPILTTFFPW